MATQIQAITADELLAMPNNGMRRELVRGEPREMTPTGRTHGKIAIRLGGRLMQYVETHELGEAYGAETGFRLSSDPDTVRAPDAAFIRRERVEQMGDLEGYLPGGPDLAVEVISPTDRYIEVHEKVLEWIESGTQMVVVVDPLKRVITVYRSLTDIAVLTEDDTLDGGDVVPGWKIPVREIFA